MSYPSLDNTSCFLTERPKILVIVLRKSANTIANFSVTMHFKVTCDDVMVIFAVWCWNQINTCLSIPNYHHWNYVLYYLPSYRVLKVVCKLIRLSPTSANISLMLIKLNSSTSNFSWCDWLKIGSIAKISHSIFTPSPSPLRMIILIWSVYIYEWHNCRQ